MFLEKPFALLSNEEALNLARYLTEDDESTQSEEDNLNKKEKAKQTEQEKISDQFVKFDREKKQNISIVSTIFKTLLGNYKLLKTDANLNEWEASHVLISQALSRNKTTISEFSYQVVASYNAQ